MSPILLWILCYTLPAWLAVAIAYRLPYKEQRMLTIHAGLVVSIVLLAWAGARISWQFPALYVALLAIVLLTCAFVLGARDALLYVLSCIIQEACILLAGSVLFPRVGVLIAAIVTAIVFALAHRMNLSLWWLRFLIIGGWGLCSVLLYAWLREPLLNISLHALGGAVLIYFGVLFPTRHLLEGR